MIKYHIVKRDNMSTVKKILLYVSGIVFALVILSVMLLCMGIDPFAFFGKMLSMNMIGNKKAYIQIESLIREYFPLLITSLALSLAFKMRFWNIGGEGQFIIGSVAAMTVGILLQNTVDRFFLLLLMCITAMIVGGLYGLIAAALKVKFQTNETLITLMLNYIALYFITFLGETQGKWNFFLTDKTARATFTTLDSNNLIYMINIGKFRLNTALLIGAVICVFVYIYLRKTRHGYELSVVGDSEGTATYAGIKVSRVVLRTVFLSAGLIGLAGGLKVATNGTVSTSMTGNVGWTGVIVAWLSKLNTVTIIISAFLISIVRFGCSSASSAYSAIDANFADILQGLVLFAVLAADFIIRFKIVRREAK